MKIKRNTAMRQKSAAYENGELPVREDAPLCKPVCGKVTNNGTITAINKIKTIIMLKAIIRYLNFNGKTPIIIHHYNMNHKIKLKLRQRYFSLQEVK